MVKGKVSKKFALYPPKSLLEGLGLKEGTTLNYVVEGGRLIVEPVMDPLDLALSTEKWTKTSVREFEEESEREQGLYG
ncbi:MAG: AbrB/MazE/SpoVT family DNA-binding domain-containing protein [Candidatus Bathyarchaeia archaeon]